MPIEIQIFVTLFFGVFQTVGAAFIGQGARQMLDGNPGGGPVFGGALFAGSSTFMSFVFMHEINAWSFPMGVAWFFLITLATIFAPAEILQRFGATAATIGLGGFTTVVGFGVLLGTLKQQEEILFGFLFGGCWGSVGLGFLLMGLRALFSGKPLRFRLTGTGKYTIESTEENAQLPAPSPKKKKPHS